MKRYIRYLATGLALASASALASEAQVTGCDPGDATVHVDGMGMVTMTHLQTHMAEMKERLDQARRTQAASSAHRKLLEQHMAGMEKAAEQLTAAVAAKGCVPGAPTLEARVANLEKRLDAMQQLLQQIVGHQREAERR